ncbi:MAG: nicotinate (nicotinamide) nucleotide adenylyltransferase [Myxococcota bacterium]|nr:nicotinate (nicotinamide) nucleotide adenylyltransferase [Myxococcota bacterium]
MRVAVYGGSFNPPHVAHAMVAAWLLWTEQVDEVWLIPVYHHAFEGQQDKKLAVYEDRVAWCRALAQDVGSGVRVDTIESLLPRPSYTIDTLRALSSSHPEHRFRLVIGADVLPQLPRWRDWEAIESEFAPVVVGREGFDGAGHGVCFPQVSSTEIRRRLSVGDPVDHLLTRSVRELLVKS